MIEIASYQAEHQKIENFQSPGCNKFQQEYVNNGNRFSKNKIAFWPAC